MLFPLLNTLVVLPNGTSLLLVRAPSRGIARLGLDVCLVSRLAAARLARFSAFRIVRKRSLDCLDKVVAVLIHLHTRNIYPTW